jgi:predicted RNA-binding Zn ribbon-like protein
MGERPTPRGLLLVQDLINTLDIEAGQDSLTTPDGPAELARRHDVRLGPADVPGARRLREALRAACRAHTGGELAPESLAELNDLLAAAPLTLRLDPSGAAVLESGPSLTARVAAAIAVAGADGTWQRLKACESHGCQWAYYDHSPAGRRRWCSMQVCGARAKMRAYRARRGGPTAH